MKVKIVWMVFVSLLLTGCDQDSVPSSATPVHKNISVNPLDNINARLAFTCKHETIPAASADTDMLFNYARWLQKNNQLKQDKAVDGETERLYRIAAENGHYKASINLQNGALRGQFALSGHERLRLSQRLIDAKVATGYYFIAMYLEHGAAGLKQEPELALRYYRKAADEGNPQAQAYVGDKLAPVGMAPDISRQMLRCAAEQGDGKAAGELGIDMQINERYQDAIEAFQLGVAVGDGSSARFLANGFNGPEPTDPLYYLAQPADPERARRYKVISKILSNYSYASPVVPEINDIVPLPPAPLPEWDGRLKWVEEREANIPPPKPGEALIAELARAKQLNPATGRPLPSSPDFEKDGTALLLCRSGEPCPKSGYWQPAWQPNRGVSKEEIRYVKQGEIMPTDRVEWRFVGEA
ncbi:sel1 repeat family protein [Enterobacter cancerogenus]|uniref:Sel1 repeat family protein n=1 Tax=Enterobacter cancerogenus TaxID=69218 RepID=A0AB38NYC7_9ENTR|nr:DUF6396 domain-containing protein [Enterobacter cancerogenus]TKK13765.1 sel1 repeat family protein [Enterobacter cancerogenus]